MASISGSRPGGKMVRTRRTASVRTRTPYDRPAPPSQSRSPNWLSRFVISPTRFVASGAGKLFSSVLDLDSSPTSSSSATSSASSSANDSAPEEIGAFDDENDSPVEGDAALNKGLQVQSFVGNSKNKHIIEQLLMEESFSREECDRLIKILRSRVIDPAYDDEGDKRPMDIPNRTLGSGILYMQNSILTDYCDLTMYFYYFLDTDSPDLRGAAVLEAKKWLQEKKSRLDSNSDIGYGSPSLNLVTLPQGPKDEGSPVDMAKSYMRSRPQWASPSIDHTKPRTPSGIRLFKEETPHLFGDNSSSSSKLKRDSPATGSWSIQDEIRRVRSRATEEMLRTLPSSKIDLSAFTTEHKTNLNSSTVEHIGASWGERVHNFTNLADASANLARELGSLASPDSESKRDGFQPDSLLSDPANINFEQNQGSVAVQQTTGTQDDSREINTSGLRDRSLDNLHRDGGLVKVNGINDTNGSDHQLDPVEETREALNSRAQDGNHFVFTEKVGAEDTLANGFPSSGPSVYAGQVDEQNTKTSENEPITIDSSQEGTAQDVVGQDSCKLLREPTEVPDAVVDDSVAFKEDDGAASGSQNSSSVQHEVLQNSSLPGLESGLTSTPTSIAKSKGTRITRYNRRGRSKGVK